MKCRFPFDLVSISPLSHILLNIDSKDELLDLCDDYQIACTKSMNKTDLADRIEAMLLKHPEQFARCLPLSDLLALKKIVQAGGVLQSKEPLETIVLESQMLVLSPSETPIKGEKTETVFRYAIAQNLQNVLKPIINRLVADPKLKVLDKNERTLLGFLRLYGVLTEATLRVIWEKTTKELLDPYDLIQLFRTRIALKQEFKPFYADNKLCFAPAILDSPWAFYEKIKKRSDLEYAQYPIDVVLSYADSPFYSKNSKALLSLIQWLNDKNEGDNMLTALQLGIIWESVQTGEKMTELMQKILETSQWGSIQDLNELMLRLTEYTNETPHWILKGHTPGDLHATQKPINLQDPNFRRDLNEQLKQRYPDATPHQMWRELDEALPPGHVGRNDPCPCGSGKKYKKCCGAN